MRGLRVRAGRRSAPEHECAGRSTLTLAEWTAFDTGLDKLLSGFEKTYWEIKFFVLIND